jgi:hypothetical protein
MVNAQQLIDVTYDQGIQFFYYGIEYGGGVSFADFNQDGWDDLSLCQQGMAPSFFMNNNGEFESIPSFMTNTGEMKNMNWVDYDNDGDLDLFATRFEGPYTLMRNEGDMVLTDVTASAGFPTSNLYLGYGSAWGDYDRDGDLDVYLSNYNAPGFPNPTLTNLLFNNNGNGTFTNVTALAGVSNGSCYTFMSLWIDYDNDMWPDLLVTNDRSACDNYLYRNNRNGTFTDVSMESGIGNHFIFSMNANGDDVDNDGDLDTFISNNLTPHLYHRNNGDGTFTEAASDVGLYITDFGWSSQFFDFNNDTWLDLHICCKPFWQLQGQDLFFKNDGDGTFTNATAEVGLNGDASFTHSSAVGDFNNDGVSDLFVMNDDPVPSHLYQGPTTNNNYLKVNLHGTFSNTMGVGSWIECYAGGNKYVKYTYCGEAYLAQNSYTEIFGLGTISSVDSLKVLWPSGIVDTWYDLQVDQTIELSESESFVASIQYIGDIQFCPGESVILDAGVYESYLWNNGYDDRFLTVTQAGNYSCTVTHQNGFEILSDTIEVSIFDLPQVEVEAEAISCYGFNDGEIHLIDLSEAGLDSISWNDGMYSGTELLNVEPGIYNYWAVDLNGCATSGSLAIIQPDSISANLTTIDNICFGYSDGQAVLETFGGTGELTLEWTSGTGENLVSGIYEVSVTDENGCAVTLPFTIEEPSQLIGQLTFGEASFVFGPGYASVDVFGGVAPYEVNWSNNMETDSIGGLEPGIYACLVTDANGCTWEEIITIEYNDIDETNTIEKVNIYPNPVKDILFLNINQNEKYDSVQLIDAEGKLLKVLPLNSSRGLAQMDVSFLSAGAYFIQISGKNKELEQTIPFVKE